MLDVPVPGDDPIVSVGIDVVAIERFAASLRRTPALADRLFTATERLTEGGFERGAASLAARFAAKEAVAKALGVPPGLDWHDCRVRSEATGRPVLEITGTVQTAARQQGITGWRVSLSHDAGIAAAVVLALGRARETRP